MASAAEQLAKNMNFSAFAQAKELQQRILFTIGILIVYRIGTFIPIPGIDMDVFSQTWEQQRGILPNVNVFAGGAIERMAIFALNVMPYITASIIMQLMRVTVPTLEKLHKEGGQAGRQQLNQYTRYLTVILAAFQGFALALTLEATNSAGISAAVDPG